MNINVLMMDGKKLRSIFLYCKLKMYEDRKMMTKILAWRRIRPDNLVLDVEGEQIKLLENLNFSIN